MPKNAQEYITAFRNGENFTAPSVGLIIDGKPDDAALQLLGEELAVADASIRENIVLLLVEVGLQTDPSKAKGTAALRNLQIIKWLAGPGIAKPDLGREAAMDALRKLVMPRDLAGYGDAFVKALEEAPAEEAFLLVAKAKPMKAKILVNRLAGLPKWEDKEAAKIARAALGAEDIEDEFLAACEAAEDGEELAQALGPLALIGTPRCLKEIAKRMRTPLTIDRPGAFEKSVRLNVLEALLYNFPDQPVLYPNNINSAANYTLAEHFCTATFDVEYDEPQPPFLTYRGYPIPLRK